MFTIFFIILKLTHSLLLSWFWVILAFVIDVMINREYNSLKQRIYELEDKYEKHVNSNEDESIY
jgi:hypothetical protein